MSIPEPAIAFGAIGLLTTAYTVYQLCTGKSLEWWFSRETSRTDLNWLYGGNVRSAGFAGIACIALAVGMIIAANPSPPDPSAPAAQGQDLVVHGTRSSR